MDLANYRPQQPHILFHNKIKELFLVQKPRQFKVQKPPISANLCQGPSINEPEQKIIHLRIEEKLTSNIRSHFVKKIRSEKLNKEKQKQMQQNYNKYLLGFLHFSNLEAAKKKQPPQLSVLECRDEGDYPEQPKQKPHWSNVIKFNEIPFEKPSIHRIPFIKKLQPSLIAPSIENTCVLKIKVIQKFVKVIFKFGSEDLQLIADKLSLCFKTTKLLYDLFEDFFSLENKMQAGRRFDRRNIWMRKIRKFISSALMKYKERQANLASRYIPFQEQYMDLKQIRECLAKYKEDKLSSSDEES